MIKILHVEDDEDIREITQLSLSLSGRFALRQCDSGEQALAAVDSFKPDVLLLDVMMPGMSGIELLSLLRDKPGLQDVPAIFITARVQQNEINGFLKSGAVDVISKPFDPVSLGDQIAKILDRARQA